MARKKLRMDNIQEAIFEMSEGNPGAVNVLCMLIKDDPMGFMDILNLDDMNMRGSQIWVAYKDHCKSDIEKLRTCLRDRDVALVETVNASQGHAAGTPRAVTGGASAYR